MSNFQAIIIRWDRVESSVIAFKKWVYMTRQLVKTTKLGKGELRDIKKLVSICAKEDQFETKLYWNILQDRKIPEFDDFLFYQDGNLIAYMGLFVFKEKEAEVTACVHPKYRKQGLYSRLFEEALLECKRRSIETALLLCNRGENPGEDLCKNLGGVYSHAEIEMMHTQPIQIDLPEIELREVGEPDVMELAKMDSVCFGTDFDKMVFRFFSGLKEKKRTVWMATLNGNNVGKTHIRFDEGRKAYIHDLCVPPENQRKGVASGMVNAAIIKLKKMGYPNIYLDVEEKNPKAIGLYEKTGFEITAIHDFYRYPIEGVEVTQQSIGTSPDESDQLSKHDKG